MDEFWGVESETSLRAVDVYVTKLRDKFSSCDGFQIVTVRGQWPWPCAGSAYFAAERGIYHSKERTRRGRHLYRYNFWKERRFVQ